LTLRYDRRLAILGGLDAADVLAGGGRGIEKESLRIAQDGSIAQTPHPAALGSALTHRYITTDYSEALLEFVTPPEPHDWAVLQFLCDIHSTVYEALEDELLWPFSMPCQLTTEAQIPVAQYGSSNIGRMKTIYREGLGHRYGRFMQVIAGIHFNYSLPDAFWPVWQETERHDSDLADLKSAAYLGLVRNVRRLDWLLLYLFGASPAVCPSFVKGRRTSLKRLNQGTLYDPWATSLRMSDIGYQNSNQAALYISANSLDEYIDELAAAVATPNPEYVLLGVKENGNYLQLNANQLQIENEYYSTIRPKRVAFSGERPTLALRRAGIEYVELRALDISPFDPVGMGHAQQKFLEAFLIYALLLDSPPIDGSEQEENRSNHLLVARSGRQPGLRLKRQGAEVTLAAWASEICEQMLPICELLDGSAGSGYRDALAQQRAAVADMVLTPSARLLAELDESGQGFADYGLQTARRYADYFAGLAPDLNRHRSMFAREATESLFRQEEIERNDDISLDEYIERYYS
jgi:glutamate--cysteine ligase